MNNEILDEIFLSNGVAFFPWIGTEYENGFKGHRVLILGESHYDNWEGIEHKLQNDFTRGCIREIIDQGDCANFWKTLEQALLNEPRQGGWAPSGGGPLWSKLSFYNFVQSPVIGGARVRPTRSQFESGEKPFRIVLEHLRPDRILVCGRHLWSRMPNIESVEDRLHDYVQAYRLNNGTPIWCLATIHPSSGGYSWSSIHPLILAFLDDPSKAAKMLQNS